MFVIRSTWFSILVVCGALPASAGSEGSYVASPGEAGRDRHGDYLPFRWKPALVQSFAFLSIEHSARLSQAKTRREFRGKFFDEWGQSIANIRGWGDGDGVFTNYVGHPMQGCVAGFIQVHNDPRGQHLEFGHNRYYWTSRARALGWAALYSTQFEIGPVSEATIGHVGKRPGTAGAVDLVITPTAGVGLLVIEDIVDRYVIKRLEARTAGNLKRIFLRTLLNPDRTFANVLRWRTPWHRDTRPGVTYQGP